MLRILFAAVLALGALAAAADPAFARNRAHQAAYGCSELDAIRGLCLGPAGRRPAVARRALFSARPAVATQSRQASQRASNRILARAPVMTEVIGGRPAGCPRQFCGCSASLYLFGRIIPRLNLAANWFGFPRAAPAPRMAAVRRHHVFVLESQVAGDVWIVHDGNSGGRQTRRHARSIAGYVIVNPLGAS